MIPLVKPYIAPRGECYRGFTRIPFGWLVAEEQREKIVSAIREG